MSDSDSAASHPAKQPLTLPPHSLPLAHRHGNSRRPLYGLGWRSRHADVYQRLKTNKCLSSIQSELLPPLWEPYQDQFPEIDFAPLLITDIKLLAAGEEDALLCLITFNRGRQTMDALAAPGALEAFVDAARKVLNIESGEEEDKTLMWYRCSVL
ncbi:hypothetical protein C8R47DRAFT_1149612 [Mycena vitilis]|nr:hypothetical protein C8R47DRAFT_1149612 [Mycena vitilis]